MFYQLVSALCLLYNILFILGQILYSGKFGCRCLSKRASMIWQIFVFISCSTRVEFMKYNIVYLSFKLLPREGVIGRRHVINGYHQHYRLQLMYKQSVFGYSFVAVAIQIWSMIPGYYFQQRTITITQPQVLCISYNKILPRSQLKKHRPPGTC